MKQLKIINLVFFLAGAGIVAAGWYMFHADEEGHRYIEDIIHSGVDEQSSEAEQEESAVSQDAVSERTQLTSEYLGNYTISDSQYGTEVTATVANGLRTIVTNALPNHQTGEFPNDGNPNAISAQSVTYEIPLNPVFTGGARFAREPGVAINGVKFEPETAERVTCSSGEQYKVEAIQDFADLGLDFNNAHVQPTGEYHYHGVSDRLVDLYDTGSDLVHVGFALDGHLIYYSHSGAYQPSYTTKSGTRTGTSCELSLGGPGFSGDNSVTVAGTAHDGTYVSDWEFNSSLGDLDECNGTTIDGEYVYLLTDEYPYIGRCLNGEFEESTPDGPPTSGASQSGPGGSSSGGPQGQQPPESSQQGPPPRR